MTLPLAGLLVADLTQNVAGPFCTQILGDLGADVVKVERPGRGDDARAWAPPWWGAESATFMAMNRNKRSLALDVKAPAGAGALRRLLGRADVVVQSLRAGVAAELGLDFPAVRTLNPRVVYCAVTAYGSTGPLAARPGYDALMQAHAGLMSVNGHPGMEPARVGTSIVDMGTGMWAALGILAGLRERDRTGQAVEVTAALWETALAWVGYHAMGWWAAGEPPRPQGSGTAMIVPYQAFPTADGWAMIAAASDALYTKLADALEAPELLADPRFRDNPARVAHRAAVVEAVARRTRRWKTRELVERCEAAGVPAAPILGVDAALAEPQARAGGMVLETAHPRLPDYRSVGLPLRLDGARPPERRVPPLCGEHSADVLAELGYASDEIAGFRAAGVTV